MVLWGSGWRLRMFDFGVDLSAKLEMTIEWIASYVNMFLIYIL